ncbi:efflux RND transporter periplasmic adaptor subunit [Saccharophagus degradans]|uniref:Efflux RND transporter periplasmic adaptor subunit n=1 Tax=Saccharophagus degradans TaxID=86304 RepID=A0AAW7WZ94_9GAMM|nr:efflux RND transporter periplasmic adaptor subunit [Saccharophagus degradans]MBU2985942.1 efflux RND transporter periplasmic adaptor subunit [Saccharophagus degradans]MDO6420921.1 efflux RND transporter periplasmic adaptor subunit [Saccharophagus degradans]MDO6606168.1 efflux RND transporter periplasmic adaptor subunit [Saccharophagus degradans]
MVLNDKPLIIKLLPLIGLLGVIAIVIAALLLTRPQADRSFTPPETQVAIAVNTLEAKPYTVQIQSYGLVQPRIQTQLTAQVGGKVDFVAESFRDGGFFEAGETLIAIEQADYLIAVTAAEASYLEAEQALIEEQARAEQARLDWSRSGSNHNPAPLVLREPQVAAAKARLKAAEANLAGAKLDLARTKIKAPYSGRVLTKHVDIGNVISTNSALADIYATDAVEVKLPIRNNEINLLQLPETYRVATQAPSQLPRVTLVSDLVEKSEWEGSIVRTSGAIETDSRQIYVVARVEDPFGEKALNKTPLKIRQYVTANIEGKTLPNAIVIPNKTIYQGSYVYLYRDGQVHRQPIKVLWQNESDAIIAEGLTSGDQLVVTPLGQVASGTRVKISGAPSSNGGEKRKGEWKKDGPRENRKQREEGAAK